MRLEYWDMYGRNTDPSLSGWKIAFKGGKLLSLKNLGTDTQSWWDRMDRPSDDLKVSSGQNYLHNNKYKNGKNKNK